MSCGQWDNTWDLKKKKTKQNKNQVIFVLFLEAQIKKQSFSEF